MRQNGRIASPEVQCARPRDGDFRQQRSSRLEELEIAGINRVSPADPALDKGDRLRAPAPVAASATRFLAVNGVDADIAKLLIEKAVIGAPPELAIGGELK